MSNLQTVTCHGWSLDMASILAVVRADKQGIEPALAIRALPGAGEPLRENPHRGAGQAEMAMLCRALGWTRLDRLHTGLCSLCYPQATPEALRICELVMAIVFVLDDLLEQAGAGRAAVEALAGELEVALAGPGEQAEQIVGDDRSHHPLITLAMQISRSLDELGCTPAWKQRFRRAFGCFIDAQLRLNRHRADGASCVDLTAYLELRYHDISVGLMLVLLELAQPGPPGQADEHLLADPELDALRGNCVFNISFANDVISYRREVADQGTGSNCLCILQNQFGLSLTQALRAVVLMAQRCFEDFERRARAFLSSPRCSAAAEAYIEGMRRMMAACLQWMLRSKRYAAEAQAPVAVEAGLAMAPPPRKRRSTHVELSIQPG